MIQIRGYIAAAEFLVLWQDFSIKVKGVGIISIQGLVNNKKLMTELRHLYSGINNNNFLLSSTASTGYEKSWTPTWVWASLIQLFTGQTNLSRWTKKMPTMERIPRTRTLGPRTCTGLQEVCSPLVSLTAPPILSARLGFTPSTWAAAMLPPWLFIRCAHMEKFFMSLLHNKH